MLRIFGIKSKSYYTKDLPSKKGNGALQEREIFTSLLINVLVKTVNVETLGKNQLLDLSWDMCLMELWMVLGQLERKPRSKQIL
jgi:ABC-type molybdenum transport system ATPase subunit/photorepair protein PhrA